MILSNYWKLFMWSVYDSDNTGVTRAVRKMDGSMFDTYFSSHPTNTACSSQYWKNIRLRDFDGVVLGSGTADVTANDYALDVDITKSLSNLTYVAANTHSTSDFSSIITINGQNNSTELSRIITEVGFYKVLLNRNTVARNSVLVARMLLDEPVNVPPGGTFKIVVDWVQS